ncbi:MAG: hypothetical protein HY322_03945 [Betaproteobacteria bacterium]|nr:hypothetical protein [Betaproteobacteria bacterium]
MRIHNLYSDAIGELRFRDIEVEWAESRAPQARQKWRAAATGFSAGSKH